jgi:hypothetical protein
MKALFLSFLLVGPLFAHQDELQRPKSFVTKFGKAVFVDFKEAHYKINYNADKKVASIEATIKFDAPEVGLPIFDSVESPTSIILDGKSVEAKEVKTPSNETTLRIISSEVSTGGHVAVITVPLKSLLEFRDGGVRSAFWTSDLEERKFLERYMPANLEYDQVKMTFQVLFEGNKINQKIYTNGQVNEVQQKGKTFYNISYPSHFNASSIFFHTVPEGTMNELKFVLKSVDGREIPAIVYFAKPVFGGGLVTLEALRDKATEVFHELEGDYGAWPHESLIIYNAGSGGMEYCGATITSFSALGHELFHSYFARGVMPANGNAGWVDEALASWRDNGYQSLFTLNGSSRMSNHPYYTRTTDMAAYSFGERFMSLMDGKLKSKGGLKPFMRYMVDKRKFSPLRIEDFIQEMGAFYDVPVEGDFKKFTFGTKNDFSASPLKGHVIHRKMTTQELESYL